MDVHDKLDQITALLEDARAMPMSASALVNRAEVLGLLDELRDLLLSDREAVVEQGRSRAEQMVTAAQVEHDRLVEQTQVVSAARERAAAVQLAAQAEAERLLAQADDYVDRKLAEFEIALEQLGQQVVRGRDRLAQRRAQDGGRPGPATDDPPTGPDAARPPRGDLLDS